LNEMFAGRFRRRSLASVLLFFTFGCAYAGTAFFFPTYFMSVRGYSQIGSRATRSDSQRRDRDRRLSRRRLGRRISPNAPRHFCVVVSARRRSHFVALVWLPTARWQDLHLVRTDPARSFTAATPSSVRCSRNSIRPACAPRLTRSAGPRR
jgi:hypothetical protein